MLHSSATMLSIYNSRNLMSLIDAIIPIVKYSVSTIVEIYRVLLT